MRVANVVFLLVDFCIVFILIIKISGLNKMNRAETDGAVVSEKDLFRQVASNLTKDQIISAK